MTVLGHSRAAASGRVTICRGSDAVTALGPEIAGLAGAVPDRAVTSGWPWIWASVAKPAAGQQPWLVGLHDGGKLVAAAVLIDDLSGAVTRTTLAGTAESHRGELLAVDDDAAAHLGAALGDALLLDLREFSLGPLPSGPAVSALQDALPVGLVIDEVDVPFVEVGGASADEAMSHGTRRTLRKARNRMSADAVVATIDRTTDRAAISAVLPLLESISRGRDIAAGRQSPLDDPERRGLWHRRVLTLASAGALELVTLHLNDDLAAYVLGIEDGRAYRILEGRCVGHWARYAPGRVLEAAVLERVATSPRFDVLDWMTGIAPETLLASNGAQRMVVVRGRS